MGREVVGVRVALSILEQRTSDDAAYEEDDGAVNTCWFLLCSALRVPHVHQAYKLFFDLGGLKLFISCSKKWPKEAHKELYSTMLALTVNVSKLKCLRGYLKSDEFIDVFREMLDVPSEGNRLSFIAACILSQLLADGRHLWPHHFYCDYTEPFSEPLECYRVEISDQRASRCRYLQM